jgi:hypothetical protein
MSTRRLPNSKFKVGQSVNFSPSKRAMAAAAKFYRITRVMPDDGGERRYHVKSLAEVFERVAREGELLSASATPSADVKMQREELPRKAFANDV